MSDLVHQATIMVLHSTLSSASWSLITPFLYGHQSVLNHAIALRSSVSPVLCFSVIEACHFRGFCLLFSSLDCVIPASVFITVTFVSLQRQCSVQSGLCQCSASIHNGQVCVTAAPVFSTVWFEHHSTSIQYSQVSVTEALVFSVVWFVSVHTSGQSSLVCVIEAPEFCTVWFVSLQHQCLVQPGLYHCSTSAHYRQVCVTAAPVFSTVWFEHNSTSIQYSQVSVTAALVFSVVWFVSVHTSGQSSLVCVIEAPEFCTVWFASLYPQFS
ncbi:hypothetical protein PoB_001530400 [Plakobranchus ocellatus]|uniref:Uncharacterized protein n=1 Tax=Plakobranchus ocellatus TaxID=259542 RepID=A0AAV3Z0E6_9GAST|nr:hypothetical protein PoB_001530400 [Plakobranchus ocellatus]